MPCWRPAAVASAAASAATVRAFIGCCLLGMVATAAAGREAGEDGRGTTRPTHAGDEWLDDLGEYEIVVPKRVDSRGYPYGEENHYRTRIRRSVSEIPQSQINYSSDKVYYNLEAFGQKFEMRLTPYEDFIAPNMIVQHIDVNETWLEEEDNIPRGRGCFHRGVINNDPHSVVSVSICDSLMGVFHTRGQQYFIEVHPNSTSSNPTSAKPHVLYKRKRSPEAGTNACAMQGNYKRERWKEPPDPGSEEEKEEGEEEEEEYGESVARNISSIYGSSSSSRRRRARRSVSYERHVEVMVLADHRMASYHGKEIQHYILTLMSIVHSIFRDPSIGNAINIMVVRIIVMDSEKEGPVISSNAAVTLQKFCKWQHKANHNKDSTYHHDTAILITREDICRATLECDTLGLAELGTMCDSPKSCAINEDNGLSAAFTIAHEIGHLFSLPHDDDFKCLSFMEKKAVYHVMAPTIDYGTRPWTWSPCSTKILTKFLEDGYGECLLNRPHTQRQLAEKQKEILKREPGDVFSVDKQCEFVFGRDFKVCSYMPKCARLWCTHTPHKPQAGCRTQHMPWADGTECDTNKWCQRGQCVVRRQSQPIDGGWGPWRSYGTCSRTCGGGIKEATRDCSNPRPKHGGLYCLGRRVKFRSCNIQNCPPGQKTFREMQCSESDGRHFNLNGLTPNVRWIPKYAGIQTKDRCKLYCRVSKSSAYYLLKDKVRDGTKCGPDTSDICVHGHCRRAGCDNRLGSRAKRDKCGVCGGDNSSCRPITGFYNEVRYGYSSVVRIPKGATNIDIRQHNQYERVSSTNAIFQDDNYLALRNSSGQYILNGNFVVTAFHKIIRLRESLLEYSGANHEVERINGTRMLHEDIEVQVLSVGKVRPPDIRYTYTISMGGTIEVMWSRTMGPWKKCSRVCQGNQDRRVVCIRKEDTRIVSDQRCEQQGINKPRSLNRKCNPDCSFRWSIVGQTECSVRCGKGTLTRRIRCLKTTQDGREYVADHYCGRVAAKPLTVAPCNGKCDVTHWSYTEWSKCSVSCGGGLQERKAVCADDQGAPLSAVHCDRHTKINRQSCNEEPCPRWVAGHWTGCSVTCGLGIHRRQVWCKRGETTVSKLLCNRSAEPNNAKACKLGLCPVWFSDHWSKCSVTCGEGIKYRVVQCRTVNRNTQPIILKDSECDAVNRPRDQLKCHYPPCQLPVTTTAPPPVSAALSHTQWRTGSWTECSVTCGEGRRERYVSCRDQEGNIAEEAACEHLPKPVSVEPCKQRACGNWRTGEWARCSLTCGGGVEQRYVSCMVLDDLEEQMTSHSECDVSVKPAAERTCNQQLCLPTEKLKVISIDSNHVVGTTQWRAGPWGGCSSTCEGGWQRRQVVCEDENGPSNLCGTSTKPIYLQACNSGPCPRWNYGDWGPCTKTCNGGTQDRIVSCQLPNGNTLLDSSCDILQRPSTTQQCNQRPCTPTRRRMNGRWQKGPWTSCSVSCGRGHRTRRVVCVDAHGNQVPDEVCRNPRPKLRRRCRAGRCPRWMASPWKSCSVTCGRGIQKRDIRCVGDRQTPLDPARCSNQTAPPSEGSCRGPDCVQYAWKTKAWSRCSVTCGRGHEQRHVICTDSVNDHKVAERHCSPATRPKSRRRCSDNPCPYRWVSGDWTQCSTSCGIGLQSREVQCRSVTREGWVTTRQVAGCRTSDMPPDKQRCNHGDCTSRFKWKTGPWGQCSSTCGRGRSHREVHCVASDGVNHPRSHCRAEYIPDLFKLCDMSPCYADTCGKLRKLTTVRRDGEYSLLVRGKLISIFCRGMRKANPTEYLSLSSGYKNNFGHVFNKRPRRSHNCPKNNTLSLHCTHKCKKSSLRRTGYTAYSKVRLNITTLTIIDDDFRFSWTRGGRRVVYGSVGDCHNSDICPQFQGQFKIDLTGTGVRVADSTNWRTRGKKTIQRITFSQGREIVEGLCSGYCGYCLPTSSGLQLQIKP